MFGTLGSDRHVRAMRGMPIHSRDVFPRGGGRYNSPKKGRGEGGEIEIKGGGGRLRASEGVRARDDCGIYQLACGAFRHRAWVVGEHPLEWVSILLSVRWNLVVGFSGDALSNY